MFASYFRSLKEQELTEIETPKNGAWVRVENPDKKELAKLTELFDLESGHLHDAIDPLEVPRLETEGGRPICLRVSRSKMMVRRLPCQS